MKPETKALHLHIIRLLKGCLTAWQRWVENYADIDPPKDVGKKPD